jgi:hypothetical protein
MGLPTGKAHLSFSEIKMWKECSWKHKLFHIDKINLQEESPHLHYGTIMHGAIEYFLQNREMRIDDALQSLAKTWNQYGFDSDQFVQSQTVRAKRDGWNYKHMFLSEWQSSAKNCLEALPNFLDSSFHSWKMIDVEHELYEQVDGLNEIRFKGFIDAILLTKDEKGKKKVWMLDWKTASPRGWDPQKQRDFMMQAQLMLYKTFWAAKMDLDLKDIACAFVLLKKNTKPEKCIQMIPVSVGPKAVDRSQKLLRSAAKGIQSGMALKNRDSCKFCEYRGTEYCT